MAGEPRRGRAGQPVSQGAAADRDFTHEIVRRLDAEPGFEVPPRRWAVERTFGWMTRFHRPVRDNERRIDVWEAFISVGMSSVL